MNYKKEWSIHVHQNAILVNLRTLIPVLIAHTTGIIHLYVHANMGLKTMLVEIVFNIYKIIQQKLEL